MLRPRALAASVMGQTLFRAAGAAAMAGGRTGRFALEASDLLVGAVAWIAVHHREIRAEPRQAVIGEFFQVTPESTGGVAVARIGGVTAPGDLHEVLVDIGTDVCCCDLRLLDRRLEVAPVVVFNSFHQVTS